jgi:hypothetical protein
VDLRPRRVRPATGIFLVDESPRTKGIGMNTKTAKTRIIALLAAGTLATFGLACEVDDDLVNDEPIEPIEEPADDPMDEPADEEDDL